MGESERRYISFSQNSGPIITGSVQLCYKNKEPNGENRLESFTSVPKYFFSLSFLSVVFVYTKSVFIIFHCTDLGSGRVIDALMGK